MYRRMLQILTLGLVAPLLLAPAAVNADSHATTAGVIDEDALADRITERVIEALERGGYLQKQIEAGIQNYVRKQREAQDRARADQANTAAKKAKNVRRVSAERDHVRGNIDARISLIEYSDFECPFCKRFHPTAKAAMEAYDGKVNWVYRHFPLEFHNPLAQKEAEASECAAELGGHDGFWLYTDAIYARTRSNGKGFPLDGLVPLAGELGFDQAAFAECYESGRHAELVLEDYAEGQSAGISGTPGNIILDNVTGEVKVLAGAVPLARIKAAIDELLAGSK